ncbi:MAG: S8 family serine peptidase [Polyangiales bacterium]
MKLGSKVQRAAVAAVLCVGGAACSASVDVGDDAPLSVHASTQALAATGTTFVVLFKAETSPSTVAADVKKAGGTLVASYPEVGVAIARGNAAFSKALAANKLVDTVAPTSGAGIGALPSKKPNRKFPRPPRPGTSGEPLAGMQWNMTQLRAAEARAITPGVKSVIVGVLDTGIDDALPDLKGQVDVARSVTCIGGTPNTDASVWRDDVIGHGSHVAGIIAAKQNGVGTVGVAPGVSLAAVKLSEDGFVYPEAFLCGVYWAATHQFDLANASLFVDPWYYNCPTDPTQRALTIAQQRMVTFASKKGVTVIAAAGNEQQDLAHKTLDPFSPTDQNPSERSITSACKLLPVELDGVIGVSALGSDARLSYYSSYGLGRIDFAAPGGDLHVPATGNVSGQVLAPVPAYSYYYQAAAEWNGRVAVGCADGLDPNDPKSDTSGCKETYALLQGTSQAVPHVTGVAALAISKFGKLTTAELVKKLGKGANATTCPSGAFQPYPEDMPAAVCEGNKSNNGFFGAGKVDALATLR